MAANETEAIKRISFFRSKGLRRFPDFLILLSNYLEKLLNIILLQLKYHFDNEES